MQHGYRQSNTRLEPQICCTSAGVLPTSDWYDEDKEFEDKLDEVVLANVKVSEQLEQRYFERTYFQS